jgi:hypothetical protein
MVIREIGLEGVDWIYLVQDLDWCQAVVNAVVITAMLFGLYPSSKVQITDRSNTAPSPKTCRDGR